jgi:hypothetical protein
MLNSPYSSSAMTSSALPSLLTTVSQSAFGMQTSGVNQMAGLGGGQQPMSQYPPQMASAQYPPQTMTFPPYGGMPFQPAQQPPFPPGAIITNYTRETLSRVYFPTPGYPSPVMQQPGGIPMQGPPMQGAPMGFAPRFF